MAAGLTFWQRVNTRSNQCAKPLSQTAAGVLQRAELWCEGELCGAGRVTWQRRQCLREGELEEGLGRAQEMETAARAASEVLEG